VKAKLELAGVGCADVNEFAEKGLDGAKESFGKATLLARADGVGPGAADAPKKNFGAAMVGMGRAGAGTSAGASTINFCSALPSPPSCRAKKKA
jgi:hypothetical protein